MHYGLLVYPPHDVIDFVSAARAAEERGFESLFFPEHTHTPVNGRSEFPGGELPAGSLRTYDPFIAATVAATATTRLRVGTGACLVVQRDPITTAKEVASLDRLSGGRFLFGVGAGWNLQEMANHGTDPSTRTALLRERVLAMTEIWTQETAEFHGLHVQFDPIWSLPKPAQRPRPPVLVGGSGPRVFDRVLDFGDEWMPMGAPSEDLDLFAARCDELQRRAADCGRGAVPITVMGVEPDPNLIARYGKAGVTRCVFALAAGTESEIVHHLDAYTELIGSIE